LPITVHLPAIEVKLITANAENVQGSQDMPDREVKPKTKEPLTYETQDIDPENTLLPMLIGGLVLVVLGAIAVMAFV